jgi:hypothetical protein
MADYHYVSSWQLRAPIEQVWAALNDLEHLPVWYRGVQEARELVPGDARGVGRRVRYVIKGRLPLRLAFEATTTRPTVLQFATGSASRSSLCAGFSVLTGVLILRSRLITQGIGAMLGRR